MQLTKLHISKKKIQLALRKTKFSDLLNP